jgi:hypothetical protein
MYDHSIRDRNLRYIPLVKSLYKFLKLSISFIRKNVEMNGVHKGVVWQVFQSKFEGRFTVKKNVSCVIEKVILICRIVQI